MNHVITTYGGGELFNLVFNGIAALFKTDHTGILMPLIRVGLTMGLFYVLILALFRNQVEEGFKWFMWVIIATNLIFLPKTTLNIHDPLTNQRFRVDNVPFALASFAGFVSNVGRAITEQFETVFNLPDDMKYHKTGTVFASSLMRQVGQFRIVDPVFKGNMERFVNQCVVYTAMIGHKYTMSDLQNTPDIWGLVTANASPILGFLWKDWVPPGEASPPGRIVTCRDGARALNALWEREIALATATYGSRVQNQNFDQIAFFDHLQNGYLFLSGVAKSAQDILKQEMMINALEEGSNNKLSELGAASNYAATKALLQQRSTYAIAGEIAARTLPLFKNVIEALSYALFIFIVVLALLPNGYKILLTYCGILVWTQLWAPLYAVLNLIMTLYGKSETLGLGAQNGLTLLNSSAIVNTNADMMTLAAWLSVSIPFISYGIITQGAAAFVGLAHHLSSGMQSAASGAASEAVSGNISLGNFTMGTQSYQNTSAFQHNTSPSYSASQFKALNASGVEQSTFADGTQSFNDQALSRLSVQIMGTENTSYAKQQSLSDAKSMAHSKSVAAGKATEASLQDSTNFMQQVGKHMSANTDWSKNMSESDAQTLQNFKSYVDDIQKSKRLTESQAVEAAIAANLGIGILGGNASFSKSGVRQEDIQAAQSIAQQKNYTDSFDKINSAARAYSDSTQDTKLSELGQSATASLNQAKHLREEESVAQNRLKTISDDVSSSQSKGLTVNKDLTQDVLQFIAEQPINAGPNGTAGGQIGYDSARRILEKGGEERDAYLQRFQEENPQYKVQSVNSAQEKQAIETKYDGEANKLRADNQVHSQNTENTEKVLEYGKQKDLDLNKDPSQTIREEVETQLSSKDPHQDDRIEQGKQFIEGKEKFLEAAKKDSEEKNMTASLFKDVVSLGHSSSDIEILSKKMQSSDVQPSTSSVQVASSHAPENTHRSFSVSPASPGIFSSQKEGQPEKVVCSQAASHGHEGVTNSSSETAQHSSAVQMPQGHSGGQEMSVRAQSSQNPNQASKGKSAANSVLKKDIKNAEAAPSASASFEEKYPTHPPFKK